MDKYFVGKIDLSDDSTYDRLIEADNLIDAKNIIDRYIKNRIKTCEKMHLNTNPTGNFTVRPATTEEILIDQLTDFAGGWDGYSLPGFAEEIIETVLQTVPKSTLINELERRKEAGEA